MYTLYHPKLKQRAKDNRNTPTKAENQLWYQILQNQKTGYKFLRQKPIDNYIVDFYCAKLKLVIEVDGDSHADQKTYDEERTKKLNQLGLKVIRYKNSDILKHLEGVYIDLEMKIKARATSASGG